MKKIEITTTIKKMLADVYTPVGIYLRVRDRFRDTILLESTDNHVAENSYSFIGIHAIAGIEITDTGSLEYKLPGQEPERIPIKNTKAVPDEVWAFMNRFEITNKENKEGNSLEQAAAKFAQGLYGYTTYDAVQFFDSVKLTVNREQLTVDSQPSTESSDPRSSEHGQRNTVNGQRSTDIPLMRYRLYQYVIAINHFKDELYLCENVIPGIESDVQVVESLIKSKDVPTYPFAVKGGETSNITNEAYVEMVKKGIQSCFRGDVFQIVLSRRFQQSFTGDELNVYRALRNINPSPYLFFFDYGDYKLMGSSPESQLIINKGTAVVHPIAGTFKRTGNDALDAAAAEKLLLDPKENAEHVMLVDLARNDLSRVCDDVRVKSYRQVQYYSHVIHLVSEVNGTVRPNANPFELLAKTFPAGTLSGAPKIKAMHLIDSFETTSRSYYGGGIGFMGFDGSCNLAIMIRTFLSKNNTLYYQAGAGVVAASNPESELQEVNNKLNALKKAIEAASEI